MDTKHHSGLFDNFGRRKNPCTNLTISIIIAKSADPGTLLYHHINAFFYKGHYALVGKRDPGLR
jgi:hypothetical protein